MNIIVSNKQKEIIDNANIDAIKDLNGLFNVDDLIDKLRNYFFSKVILDATSVVGFTTPEVLEKLANEIGTDRLIILLPVNIEPPKEFLEKLINLKIYNFSNNINDVINLINNSNTYDDVRKYVTSDQSDFYVDSSITNNDINNDSIINDLPNNNESMYSDDELNVDDDYEVINNSEFQHDTLNVSPNNQTQEKEELNNSNYFIPNNPAFFNQNMNKDIVKKRIIGIKNITEHAGSTTLTYLLTKTAIDEMHHKAIAIEVNKNDFVYFQYPSLISLKENQLENMIQTSDAEIIFVDLNNCENISICDEVLYLVEPSIIKLNKQMMLNRNTFIELKGRKVLLNKSMLSENDVKVFSKEAGMDMFYNLEPLNDRVNNRKLLDILNKLEIN